MSNIKTVIAAGGLGTRLQGFRGNDSTKILLEVDGSPMIIRQIEQLTNWGLDEFIIITNPSIDELIKEVVNSYFPDKKIILSKNLILFLGDKSSFIQKNKQSTQLFLRTKTIYICIVKYVFLV